MKHALQDERARKRDDQGGREARRGIAVELQVELERLAEMGHPAGSDRTIQNTHAQYVADLGALNVGNVSEATALESGTLALCLQIAGQQEDQVHPSEAISGRSAV